MHRAGPAPSPASDALLWDAVGSWQAEAAVSELEDILQAFGSLVAEHEKTTGQDGDEDDEDTNFRCVDCIECRACRFCTSCERCNDCTYCDACTDCAECTQSRECLACADCSQSSLSAYCERSSYLTLCLDCEGCVQCFACVGLSDAEFCILNQKYKRSVYFKKVAQLRMLLDAKLTEGWMPPWSAEVEPDEPEELPEPPSAQYGDAEGSHVALEADEPSDAGSADEGRAEPAIEDGAEERREDTPPEPEPEPEEDDRLFDGGAGVVTTIAPEPETQPMSIEPLAPDPPARAEGAGAESRARREHTGSWPPVDHHSARMMDREARTAEPWEELFEPDELPPPRVPVASTPAEPGVPEPVADDASVSPSSPASGSVSEPEPEPSTSSETAKPEPLLEAVSGPSSTSNPKSKESLVPPAGTPADGDRWGRPGGGRSRWEQTPSGLPTWRDAAPSGPGESGSDQPPPGFLGTLPTTADPGPSTEPEPPPEHTARAGRPARPTSPAEPAGGLRKARRPPRRDKS